MEYLPSGRGCAGRLLLPSVSGVGGADDTLLLSLFFENQALHQSPVSHRDAACCGNSKAERPSPCRIHKAGAHHMLHSNVRTSFAAIHLKLAYNFSETGHELQRRTAVDAERHAGDVRGSARAEEDADAANVLRRANAACITYAAAVTRKCERSQNDETYDQSRGLPTHRSGDRWRSLRRPSRRQRQSSGSGRSPGRWR